MKINITLSGNKYGILVDTNCYVPAKYNINSDPKSNNFGKETETHLGYYKSISHAALRLIREDVASRDEEITLKEFASLIERLNREFIESMKGVEV